MTAPEKPAVVEVVDHRHARWPLVLKLLDDLGQRKSLDLDKDGWLPARQSVLVAFVDDQPTGHLSFHLHPIDREHVEAHLDAVGFLPAAATGQLSGALRQAALRRARELRCSVFRGIDQVRESPAS